MGKIVLIFLMLIALSACGSSNAGVPDLDNAVGHWSWQQVSVSNPVNPGYPNTPSLCLGDLDVYPDGTFHIWNACKLANKDCYLVVSSDGTWDKREGYLYRFAYEPYYYEIFLKGEMGNFMSMSVANEYDRGHYEYGVLYKNVYIDSIKEYYEARECAEFR